MFLQSLGVMDADARVHDSLTGLVSVLECHCKDHVTCSYEWWVSGVLGDFQALAGCGHLLWPLQGVRSGPRGGEKVTSWPDTLVLCRFPVCFLPSWEEQAGSGGRTHVRPTSSWYPSLGGGPTLGSHRSGQLVAPNQMRSHDEKQVRNFDRCSCT